MAPLSSPVRSISLATTVLCSRDLRLTASKLLPSLDDRFADQGAGAIDLGARSR